MLVVADTGRNDEWFDGPCKGPMPFQEVEPVKPEFL